MKITTMTLAAFPLLQTRTVKPKNLRLALQTPAPLAELN
jgi:hypothetical protein